MDRVSRRCVVLPWFARGSAAPWVVLLLCGVAGLPRMVIVEIKKDGQGGHRIECSRCCFFIHARSFPFDKRHVHVSVVATRHREVGDAFGMVADIVLMLGVAVLLHLILQLIGVFPFLIARWCVARKHGTALGILRPICSLVAARVCVYVLYCLLALGFVAVCCHGDTSSIGPGLCDIYRKYGGLILVFLLVDAFSVPWILHSFWKAKRRVRRAMLGSAFLLMNGLWIFFLHSWIVFVAWNV